MRCRHLGEAQGIEATADGEVVRYACNHPAHGPTTLTACATCRDFQRGGDMDLTGAARHAIQTLAGLPAAPQPRQTPPEPARGPRPDRGAARAARAARQEARQERSARREKLTRREPTVVGQHPTGMCLSPRGRPLDLDGLYQGCHAFAVLGGPSLQQQPLEILARRGVLVLSTNNCPAGLPTVVRPHVWIHSDPTHKFHWSIWRDPAVLKFTPLPEWTAAWPEARPRPPEPCPPRYKPKGLLRRGPDGLLEFAPGMRACDCPGVVGYYRNTTFNPDSFLWEPSINRGNDKDHSHGAPQNGMPANGWPHTINTIFSVLRLAFYLGVQRITLLGADFHMDAAAPYSFNQHKHAGGVRSNNQTYAHVCTMLDALQPKFLAAGFTVQNATPGTRLWTFPEVRFEEAVEEASAGLEQELNCAGYYDEWTDHLARWRGGSGDETGRVAG